MTRPCDSAHDDPVPPAVMVGTLCTSGYNTGPLVYPDTAYCRECIDIIGDDFADRKPLGSYPSQTSASVDAPPEERAPEVSAPKTPDLMTGPALDLAASAPDLAVDAAGTTSDPT